MKIINAMFGCGQGGIEQALVDYCEALRLVGHEPVAIIHPEAAICDALKARNLPFHTLPNAGAWDPLAILRLRSLLARLNPDICIAHGNRAVSLLQKAKAPRIVGVMHNYKIKTGKLRFVFHPTQDLLRHAQGAGAAGASFYHIPNLVRVSARFPERHWHTPPVIGAMGRFVTKKGFDLFIEALALLHERGVVFHAVLAGDGEEAPRLKNLAQAKGLDGVLHFAGWVADPAAFFGGIDVFCLPSRHEPFGIVLLEAMAEGLPVVAAASEGPSEILMNGTDGVLVKPDDAGALATELADMLRAPPRAELFARGAWQTVKTRYDLPVVAAKLDLALRAICAL
jgi:glycosyltransferase involved in cell wall biosynthesis